MCLESIPVEKITTPTIARLQDRREKVESFAPSIPLSVIGRALRACLLGPTLIQLIGREYLLAKMQGPVYIKTSAQELAGITANQMRHALNKLSEAGMIKLAAEPGKRNRIVLLDSEYLRWLRGRCR